eukprot:TRINITY_DN17173_c0_g1_i4.p1 TRINITY_DN17173_c0_g1~~TRINITY_DN17173_c0_g1_i4.p1  ORF type:complete len:543 (+),score=76.17 TRINITY_DN17173_c0_g1_i4:59-1630(+)
MAVDLSPLEDDGTVDLVLMASDHPQIKSCGKILLERMRTLNEFLKQCAPWVSSGKFPDSVVDVSRSIQSIVGTVVGDIERLDDIDLDALKPEWGDRDSVRMARKSLIAFAQDIMKKFDALKGELAGAVAKQTQPRTETVARPISPPRATTAKTTGGQRQRSRSRSRQRQQQGEGGPDSSNSEDTDERKRNRETPHFEWSKGMILGTEDRYVVRKEVGEGSFGRVLSCLDKVSKKIVAVKVVKGVKRYQEHAEAEAEVLREILRCDPGGQSRCVRIFGEFVHTGIHCCLVFELLDKSLSDFMKDNGDEGLLLRDVRKIAQQLLQCLNYLSGMGLAHTDIKCRNSMLRDSRGELVPNPRKPGAQTYSIRKCEVVVIDFGGAAFKKERHSKRIGTRQYRAPEVVLSLPWDEKCDVWSLGCILLTLYTGERPFPVTNSLQHLALMERVIGKLPKALVKNAAACGGLPEDISVDSQGHLQFKRAFIAEAQEQLKLARPLSERILPHHSERSEERRVGKECRSRWSPYH